MEKVKLIKLIEKPISGEWGNDGNSTPVIRTTNFSNDGRLNLKEVVLRNIDLKKVESKKLQKGDIIIEKSGGSPTQPVGRVVYFELEGTYLCNNFTSILRPKRNLVYPKFLLYQLFTSHLFGFTNNFQNKTTGIINLKLERYINELEILLPPLPTQQKIATILDKADELRQYYKQLIEKYDALTQSLFLDMFGGLKDNIKSLAEVCDINPKKSEISSLDKDLKVSFLQMSNVSEKGELILNDNRSILNVWSGFTYFRENDVLFAKITPCMENGKGAIARLLTNGIGFGSTEFHVLRPITNLANSEWIYYLTMNKKFRALAEKNMTGSAGQKRVPKDFFSNYKLPIPTITLQNQFAERVAVIELQKQQAQLELTKSEALFQSLLQRAFKGELV
ncbi:MAG: restriction endonuclease subunit S [Bacteroidia bacterium]|nr:restriction endonuclease subunit S [Bacteroidia bacterium]